MKRKRYRYRILNLLWMMMTVKQKKEMLELVKDPLAETMLEAFKDSLMDLYEIPTKKEYKTTPYIRDMIMDGLLLRHYKKNQIKKMEKIFFYYKWIG